MNSNIVSIKYKKFTNDKQIQIKSSTKNLPSKGINKSILKEF
jgi:hypothetical protein